MMQILRVLGDFKNPSVPWGFAVGAHVNFGAVVGWGSGGARGETEVR